MKSLFMFLYCLPRIIYSYPYGSYSRYKFKKKFGLNGLVEDHHVIPQQWKNHPSITHLNFNIHSSQNIMMLPNHYYKPLSNSSRPSHSGGHPLYNWYVKQRLKDIQNISQLYLLIYELKQDIRQNSILWK